MGTWPTILMIIGGFIAGRGYQYLLNQAQDTKKGHR